MPVRFKMLLEHFVCLVCMLLVHATLGARLMPSSDSLAAR